jgi:hypothetical protein
MTTLWELYADELKDLRLANDQMINALKKSNLREKIIS